MTPIYCHPAGFAAHCPLCRRAQADPAFHRFALTVPAADASGTPPAAPCDFVGKPVPPPDGKPTAARWNLCEHPEQPLGAVVCGCRGCGPSCPGYDAAG